MADELNAWEKNVISHGRENRNQDFEVARMRACHICILLILLFLFVQRDSAKGPSLKDDAYHGMPTGTNDQLYNEDWYFNGMSNEAQFFISYLISDPDNITGYRRIQAMAVVLEEGKPPFIGLHQGRGLGVGRSGPTLDIDMSGISAEDESVLKVWGDVKSESGEPLKWDLTYDALTSPWFGISAQTQIGHLAGGWLKWLVYMPSAEVEGTITIDGRVREIRGAGYHDHIWGRWAFSDLQWNRAQLSLPGEDFSLSLGDALGEERSTVLGIQAKGETIKFSDRQLKLNYTGWATDQSTARDYPTAYEVQGKNGDYQLDLRMDVVKNVPVIFAYPPPLPSLIVFEEVSSFKGVLSPKDGEAYPFQGFGFSEYTTHLLHPIYGQINATNVSEIIVTATNERTGQSKTARAGLEGWFSFDADYADFLANGSAPWVEDGDRLRLAAEDGAGRKASATVIVDLAEKRQNVSLNLP